MNKTILMGRLTKDVELRYTQAAEPLAIARYTLAVNRRFGDEADFINIVAFGKSAEFAANYFKKGQLVSIVGRIQVRSYDDSNGNRKWVTEVVAEEQYFAESKKKEEEKTSDTDDFVPVDINEDELPF